MISNVITFLVIYLGTIILSLKIIHYPLRNSHQKFVLTLISLSLSIFSNVLNFLLPEFYIAPLLILWSIVTYLCSHPQGAFIATIIAFGISYCLYAISSFIALLFIFPFYSNPENFPHVILALITAIIYFSSVNGLLKIKRFQKGMPFLFTTTNINFATYTCLFFIGILTYLPAKDIPKHIKAIFPIFFIIILAFLIHWWQAQLTKSYRHSLELRELESLRVELQEKDKQLAELSAKNEQMGHVIHEDTKIIRSFISGIEDYISSDLADADTRKTKGNALLEVINNHSDERLYTIRSIRLKECKLHATKIESLNLQLNHFEKRAAAENISIHVHIACDLEKYIPHSISDSDLTHLISNLLDNAFIAASYVSNRIIQLQFYEVNKHFVIEIADSGIPFEAESLVNLGLSPLTTHANEGGSGIGLMEIWKVKEKLGATLHIEEYKAPTPYTKKISFTFNHKNRYSIRTWRKDDIQRISKRIDLQVYNITTF